MVVTSPIVVHDLNLQATILVEKIPQLNELKAIKFSLIRQFVPRCTHFCSVTWSDDCIKWLQSAGSFKTFRRRCLLFFSTSHHIWLCIWVNLMFLVLINVCTVWDVCSDDVGWLWMDAFCTWGEVLVRYLRGQRKTTQSLGQDIRSPVRNLKRGPAEHKARLPPTWQRWSFSSHLFYLVFHPGSYWQLS